MVKLYGISVGPPSWDGQSIRQYSDPGWPELVLIEFGHPLCEIAHEMQAGAEPPLPPGLHPSPIRYTTETTLYEANSPSGYTVGQFYIVGHDGSLVVHRDNGHRTSTAVRLP